LAGRVVLLTRSAGREGTLASRLERLGARVEARPTIQLAPPADPAPLNAALARLDDYDWLLFSSPNGVRFFESARREAFPRRKPPRARIAAVGPGTARELERVELTADVVAEQGDAVGLAAELRGRVKPGQRVLLVRPEVAAQTLPDALRQWGALPDTVAFYRNVPAPNCERIARDIAAGRYDAVVFSSPSTLLRLLEAAATHEEELHEALERVRKVAIGRVTAGALSAAGLEADAVAPEPTDEGLAAAVRSLFED